MKAIGVVLLSIGMAVSLSGCFGSAFSEGAAPFNARYSGGLRDFQDLYNNNNNYKEPMKDYDRSQSAPPR